MMLSHARWSASVAALLSGGFAVLAMTWFAGASPIAAAGALLALYVFGYLVGSLLLDQVSDGCGLSWAVIRTIAGLLLTTIAFLLSLVLSVPWFVGPCVLMVLVVGLRGRRAFSPPSVELRFGWDGIAAGVLAAILLSPLVISFVYMAPGSFPPVLYNIDTAYFLEKVHGLVRTDTYPAESLSNVGVWRTYHYATQAMTALISRTSGLLPHHALFLLVLPLLTAGVVAAALAVARFISPALPRSVTVPLLLLSTPSMATSFWDKFGPQLWTLMTSGDFSIARFAGDYSLWGILSNEGQNIGGDFVVLASVAGIAAAPAWGWRLPAFLIGSAILVKTPVGVALVAGFALVEAWRAVAAKRLQLSPQALIAGAVFLVTAVAFFLLSFESNFRVEIAPFYFLEQIAGSRLPGFLLDIAWLLLPVLIVVSAGLKDSEHRSIPILLMAIAPFLVVNATRMDNTRAGGGGTGEDWFQILHPVPVLLHALALSLASRRWARLGRPRRAAFLVVMALVIGPVTLVAARYSSLFLRDPANGYEFVDNRSLAEALATIPTTGTIIVTNDLRYPAQNFTRDYRQMQIPALFGHQAYAVNYAHEAVEERRGLQELLQQPDWSDAILEASRMHHWTHLLIRKDYVHPAPIPLTQVFENQIYAVFRFP